MGLFSTQVQADQLLIRQKDIWPGKNIFLFGGTLVLGPSLTKPLLVGLSLLLTTGLSLLAPPDTLLVLQLFFFLWTLFSLALTSMRDPGIIPRNVDGLSPDSALYCLPKNNFQMNSYLLATNNQTMMLKYCSTCFIHRPPRTVHCRICDNCVEVLDHHCVWLDNCIGKRNYSHFVSFLLSLTLFCLATLVRHALRLPSLLSLVFCPVSALFGLFGLYMLSYHLYLIFTNSTTNEDIKNVHSPFNTMRYLRYQYTVERLAQTSTNSLLRPREPIAMPPLNSQSPSLILLTPRPPSQLAHYHHEQEVLKIIRMSQSQGEVKTIRSRMACLQVPPSYQDGFDDAPQVCTPMQSSRVEYKNRRDKQMAMWQQTPQQHQSEVFPTLSLQIVAMNRSDNHTNAKTASRERKGSGTELFDMLDQLAPHRVENDDHLDRYRIATSQSQLAHSSVLLTRQDIKKKTPYILEEEAEVASIGSPTQSRPPLSPSVSQLYH